jgi:non-ribosomal peptide synthase protein (TIGR01720 family)
MDLLAKLKTFSRAERATPFMLLLAAFQLLLSRYSCVDDITVGAVIAGRSRPETKDMIGCFVNALAIRTSLSGYPSVRELLGRVRATCIGAYANQDLPFEKLVRELRPARDLSHSPYFSAVLSFLGESPAADFDSLETSFVSVDTRTAKFDLALEMAEDSDQLLGRITYRVALFERSTIERMGGHFRELLTAMISKPEVSITCLAPAIHRSESTRIGGANLRGTTTDKVSLSEPPDCAFSGLKSGQAGPELQRAEAKLKEIWTDLLLASDLDFTATGRGNNHGHAEISTEDNFFALGGDSILAMQMVKRAADAGLKVTLREVFQAQTIARLAALAISDRPSRAIDRQLNSSSPNIPLTPVQRWFFDLKLDEPNHWNQSVLLALSGSMTDGEIWLKVFEAVVRGHQAFHLRFHFEEGYWHQRYSDDLHDSAFSIEDLSGADPPSQLAAMAATVRSVQEKMDLCRGPVFTAVLFRFGTTRPAHLLMVGHHLVIDAVSWRILLDDLADAYQQISAGHDPVLSPSGQTFAAWSECLAELAVQHTLDPRPWILESSRKTLIAVPEDFSNGSNTEARTAMMSFKLTRDGTEQLLRHALGTFDTTIEELLIATLTASLLQDREEDGIWIELEKHGRDLATSGLDVSATVGWFTALFPVYLHLRNTHQDGFVRSIRDQLRLLPNGIEYGILRYLEDCEVIRRNPATRIRFNYLGQFDQSFANSQLFRPSDQSSGIDRCPQNLRSTEIEITAWILDGQINVQWAYSQDRHRTSTIATLVRQQEESLNQVIHSALPDVMCSQTAEFPYVPLKPTEVESLLLADPDIEDIVPLFPLQQGLLFHSMLLPDSNAYKYQFCCELEGPVEREAFVDTWQRLVHRHPALRSYFVTAGVSSPVQIIRRHGQIGIEFSTLDDSDANRDQIDHFLRRDMSRQFCLYQPPLIRISFLQCGSNRSLLVCTIHHLIADGWSISLLAQEFFDYYDCACQGQSPDRVDGYTYRPYLRWLSERDTRHAGEFWKAQLAGFDSPTVPSFLTAASADQPRTTKQNKIERTLDGALRLRLIERSRSWGVTLSTLAECVWALLLAFHAHRRDVLFGTPFAGRPLQVDGMQSMIGMFINTLPVRVTVDENLPLMQWLQQLQTRHGELTDFEHVPLTQIQAVSRVPSGTALFETLLVVENYPLDEQKLRSHRLPVKDLRVDGCDDYAVVMTFLPRSEFAIQLAYDPDRCTSDHARHILDQMTLLFEAITNHQGTVRDLLCLIEASETQRRDGQARRFQSERAILFHASKRKQEVARKNAEL